MGTPMTPAQFRAWRKSLALKQKDAAELLGVKKRIIQYYETGERDGKAVEIPKYVRLSCFAISQGIVDFDGEQTTARDDPSSRSRKGGRPAAGEADAKGRRGKGLRADDHAAPETVI
jgi:transcriptional regulator with XRE-family HTH domain